MKPIAVLFPGQGAQFPGMARRLYDTVPAVAGLFERAERQTALPLRDICFRLDREAQSRTDWTQPAMFVAGLSSWYFLVEQGRADEVISVAGHSLGHFVALVAADCLDMEVALELVRIRGELMYRAALATPGGMVSIIGLDETGVAELLAGAGARTCLAAFNGSDQFVLAGDDAGLGIAMEAATQAKAERVVRLAIGLAAHSPLMAEAAATFAAGLPGVTLRKPRVPVALNTTGELTSDVVRIRDDLVAHMTSPVQWWRSVTRLAETGALLADAGPGRTLTKVHRRDLPGDRLLSLDRPRVLGGSQASGGGEQTPGRVADWPYVADSSGDQPQGLEAAQQ